MRPSPRGVAATRRSMNIDGQDMEQQPRRTHAVLSAIGQGSDRSQVVIVKRPVKMAQETHTSPLARTVSESEDRCVCKPTSRPRRKKSSREREGVSR